MAVLGIIICETLEQEFAYLIANDQEIKGVTVLENATSHWLIQDLESRGVQNIRPIPHTHSFYPEVSEQLEVLIKVLDLSLHSNKKALRQAVVSAAHEMASCIDSLLLGYGLCGNAFGDIRELVNEKFPVIFPMDKNEPVEDCIGMLIGGHDCYYDEQKKVPGTFFMTPGWTRHWKKMLNRDCFGIDMRMIKRIFSGYTRSLMVITPVLNEKRMEEDINEFNRSLGLRVESCMGSMEILKQTWQSAKRTLPRFNSIGGGIHN